MKTATLVKQLPDTPAGASQRLWRCDPPMETCDHRTPSTEFVISSMVAHPSYGAPADLFIADSNGKVLSWGDLLGCGLNHEEAIRSAGYEPVGDGDNEVDRSNESYWRGA